MDEKEKMREMTGQKGGGSNPYPLNELRMSGDDGSFSLLELLSEKIDKKYPKVEMGKEVKGVMLRMKWRMQKFVEGQGFIRTTEYDNKNTDFVSVFPSNDKGLAVDMKEKYVLSTQRVVYFWLPERQEVVRLAVKASALSGEKNPNKEMGLFDYCNAMNENELYVNEHLTVLGSCFRLDPSGNKRKEYYATTFVQGDALSPDEAMKMRKMTEEIFERTKQKELPAIQSVADDYPEPSEENSADKF